MRTPGSDNKYLLAIYKANFLGVINRQDINENPLLFDENLKPEPAYFGVKEALKEFVDK